MTLGLAHDGENVHEPAVDDAGESSGPDVEAGRSRTEGRWLQRRRLERQLHDGAALRISAMSLRLGVLLENAPSSDDEWSRDIVELQEQVHAALQELRDVAGKIYPPLLDEAGLGPALRELVHSTGVDATLDVADDRFGAAAEGAAYFAAAECLAAPRAAGGTVTVHVRRDAGALVLSISGVEPWQGPPVEDEAKPLGGSVEVTHAGEAQRVTIVARFPCG